MPTNYAALLGHEPETLARPTRVDEVAALLAEANEAGRTMIPWGAGTGQTYGYLPRRADIVLHMGGLNRIIAHEPGDLTVTVQAGATLADVQKVLARHNQFLPLDPPHTESGSTGVATIGGILATNAIGPLCSGYGTARDWLIGLTVVDARGRIIKGGGKVVKNVTGYDLPKLHVGALGTLGVLVEATFKVAPVPESAATLVWRIPGANGGAAADRVQAFVHALHAGPLPPVLSVLHTGSLPAGLVLPAAPAAKVSAPPAADEPPRYLFAAFHGMNEVVRAARLAANEEAEKAGIAPASTLPPHHEKTAASGDTASGSSRLRVRLTGRPSSVGAQHEALSAQGFWEWVRTFPGTGHTEAALRMGEDPNATRAWTFAWAEQHHTPVALLKASVALRNADAPDDSLWWPRPASFPLLKRLKETLDPNDTLNPGRFIGRI